MRALLPYFFITVRRNDLEIIMKIFPLSNFEIIGLFANTWTADYKYPVTDCENLPFPMQIQLSENQITFSQFLFNLWNLHQILHIFRKNKIVIANVFPKLMTVQGFLTPLTIQRRLKTSFDSQPVKRFQTLVKSSWEHFYQIFSSPLGEMILKIPLWLKFEIIGLVVNTWTADYKYAVTDCVNLPFPMQIQLS